ncbi:hypothetical protein DFH08DRAFT_1087712 [Mycena albidolilacea]|uniref:Uncharacterized protein n=1 Tax=Mycena albidolilacea TaxID=1033008 RepID=A0AAD7EC34_9AGAR|nr:hypothetical protein DFH08DRAFT_1087712 [Mycena albidolilacea]
MARGGGTFMCSLFGEGDPAVVCVFVSRRDSRGRDDWVPAQLPWARWMERRAGDWASGQARSHCRGSLTLCPGAGGNLGMRDLGSAAQWEKTCPGRLGDGESREYLAARWRHLLTRWVDALEGSSCWSMRHSRSLARLFGRSGRGVLSKFLFSLRDVGLARTEGNSVAVCGITDGVY